MNSGIRGIGLRIGRASQVVRRGVDAILDLDLPPVAAGWPALLQVDFFSAGSRSLAAA